VPDVSLVWSVPVVAAAIAAGLVLARVRALEEAAAALRREVALLAALRPPLRRLREAADETDAAVAAFRAHHPTDGP
jgi:uncharacterized protein involved in exopolysaccharide biosynthesis